MGKLKLTNETAVVKITPDSISLYRYQNGPTYCSKPKNKNGDLVFMELIRDGKIRLYEYTVNSTIENHSISSLYAEKDSMGCKEVKTSALLRGGGPEGKEFFRALIADNPSVLSKFDKRPYYTSNAIFEAVEEYNKQALTRKN